jgi:Fe-S-cluster containining protein
MRPWVALDDDLVARVKAMVIQALAPAKSLEMALELSRQALQWADGLIEALESASPLPRQVACAPGCSYCCHNQVEVTPPEVFALAQVILLYLPGPRQEAIKERALRSAAFKAGKSPAEVAAVRKTQPCPLLDGDRCAAYPWRPLVCRAMHSLDREHCRTSFAAGDLSGDEYYLHRYVFPLSVSAGLREGFQALGCQAPVFDLSQALGQVLLEPQMAERWLAGQKVFADPAG